MKNKSFSRNPKWYSIILNDNWCLIPTSIMLTGWIVWLVQLQTGINLLRREDDYANTPEDMLEVAVIGTIICLPLALYRYARTRRVLFSGVETLFRVASYGPRHGAYQDIGIEYLVNGKTFTKRFSAYGNQAEGQFKLIVNPKKPKHIVIMDLD